jgi:hypothetical protein
VHDKGVDRESPVAGYRLCPTTAGANRSVHIFSLCCVQPGSVPHCLDRGGSVSHIRRALESPVDATSAMTHWETPEIAELPTGGSAIAFVGQIA